LQSQHITRNRITLLKLTALNNYDYKSATIRFDSAEKPEFKEDKKGYIQFGKDNNYPLYIQSLLNESPKHGSIIKNKSKYIFGKGFQDIPSKANPEGETWNEILKKAIFDYEKDNGYYLQIVWNLLGQVKAVYHIPFRKVRTDKRCANFWVKDDWTLTDIKEPPRKYLALDLNNKVGSQILFIKQYNSESDIYPLPEYYQGLNYIESDIQVSRHILGNAKQGFVGSTLINLNNGDPIGEENKGEVEKGLKKKFTGAEGDRVVIMFNKSKENSAEILPLGQTMLTKEDFTNINNLIQQEIFAAHQVTSPTLFGIKTEGSLGARNDIRDAYEIFNNTYVSERQEKHEEVFNKLFTLCGIQGEYEIKPVQPLGFNLTEQGLLEVMPREYFLDEMGVDQKYYPLPPVVAKSLPSAPGGAQPAGMEQVNEHLKSLGGRGYQQLNRVIRDFSKGRMNELQARTLLKSSLGLSDEEISSLLGIEPQQFMVFAEEQDFAILQQFSEVGENRNDFEILAKKPARETEYFKDVAELSKLEANVMNLIGKDKRITPEVIADALNQDVTVINRIVKDLEVSGLIKPTITTVGEDQVTERELTQPLSKTPGGDNATTTEILLRYSYEGPKDSRNRPFCARLLDLDKFYSRSDIERISERLGYSVWDRRGGWFTEPSGDHRPYCRHQWFANIVLKKKS